MESFRLFMMNNTGKVEILFDMTGFGLKSCVRFCRVA